MNLSLPTFVGLLLFLSPGVDASEPTWLTIEELVVDPIEPSLLLAPEPGADFKPARRMALSIRGVFPRTRQRNELERLGLRDEKSLKIIDFELQRQALPVDADADAKVSWEDLDLQTSIELLSLARGFAPEPASPNAINSSITMPLPERVDAAWGAEVLHPRQLDEDGHLLFRVIDFSVKPQHHYRYQVRLEVRNPYYKKVEEDPFLSREETRWTPWSTPSAAVLVTSPRDPQGDRSQP